MLKPFSENCLLSAHYVTCCMVVTEFNVLWSPAATNRTLKSNYESINKPSTPPGMSTHLLFTQCKDSFCFNLPLHLCSRPECLNSESTHCLPAKGSGTELVNQHANKAHGQLFISDILTGSTDPYLLPNSYCAHLLQAASLFYRHTDTSHPPRLSRHLWPTLFLLLSYKAMELSPLWYP